MRFLAQSKASQDSYLQSLSDETKQKLLTLITTVATRANSKLFKLFPDEGEHRRELYVKQVAFMDGGAKYKARLLMAGNRVGKTVTGCTEDTYHLTGLYPHWWKGKVFKSAVRGWVVGKTNETTRDILQFELLGKVVFENGKKGFSGTGIIPKHCIGAVAWRQGIQGLADTVQIMHTTGEWSVLGFKSYQQGRGSFEGTAQHFVHLDEEPPQPIYTECLTRTTTTQGIVMVTFTPLEGTTAMVDDFIQKANEGVNLLVQAGWNDAAHLREEDKETLLKTFPKHEHDARSKGIPYAGSGLIFAIDENDLIVEPFPIPAHFARIGALDFGWDHPTAAAVLAWDRDNDIVYLIEEYRMREATPATHAPNILEFGDWIPYAYPHDGLQHDKGSGDTLAELYEKEGLKIIGRATFDDGTNGVEAGLMEMLQRMEQGRFKVFSHCTDWLEERRMYHRKKGKVVKEKDDMISASRYAMMMLRFAKVKPVKSKPVPKRVW